MSSHHISGTSNIDLSPANALTSVCIRTRAEALSFAVSSRSSNSRHSIAVRRLAIDPYQHEGGRAPGRRRRYTQIIHLFGGPGSYNFYTLQVNIHSEESRKLSTNYVLGQFTRAQRGQIAAFAKDVQLDKKLRINNGQTWMRGLLEAMVNVGLLSKARFG
ncbi:hypothetical protein PAXRUDRAFT_9159 [Paxillus rubicundulus Ve08.2h10]|uniref:Uncharacterized protein n=1 Tax=Paxillus rubicundulus Ve08.2h10 TaxID=930991 RepID=A0A0D0E409_9AGAM|nr:hypothetical protein PAXRUDRAFT_9159 [Paxillus rubicundulus Ve08.2h10]